MSTTHLSWESDDHMTKYEWRGGHTVNIYQDFYGDDDEPERWHKVDTWSLPPDNATHLNSLPHTQAVRQFAAQCWAHHNSIDR